MMKFQKALFLFLITFLLIGCKQESPESKVETDEDKLTGLWSLHIMEKMDTVSGQWNEWRDGMQGYLLYDGQASMSLHLTTKGYENTTLRFPNFTDTISEEALKYLTNSYVYFGQYTTDNKKKIVTHHRISHSNPGDWNKVVQRNYSFSGDTLILAPVEKKNATLRLKWVKDAGNSIQSRI